MFPTIDHPYIVIEGNIGAGKTTLCEMLARDYNCRLILEAFADNPFLPFFYEHPERFAFPVELFFMTERHKQLQESVGQQSLFHTFAVADYYFVKTLLFAKNNLSGEEYRLFQRLFHILNASFPKPDLLVYLHRSVDNLAENIKHRGRAYEQQIQNDYLSQISQGYHDYFRSVQDQIPILVLQIEGVSFWKDETAYRQMLELIAQKYMPGMHFREILPTEV